MLAELRDGIHYNGLLQEVAEEETHNDKDPRRRMALMQAVSLPSRAATVRHLTGALKNLVELERKAFSVDKYGDLGKTVRRITIVVSSEIPVIEGDRALSTARTG